ncbi:hypothetical protein ACL02T_10715 [Pseudonocardia sp. RS010]|uniref:hypothetical protein n=1 Tax=Pseudonocardia sp. RS010 TaxID=3385979 RepID=UPI0039A04936
MAVKIERAEVGELLALWDAYGARQTWAEAVAEGANPAIIEQALAEVADVSPLDALEANRRVVDLLVARRWSVMREAREAGASWTEIGRALDMTKQGAQDWYRRKVAEQERYVPKPTTLSRPRQPLRKSDHDARRG